jgi:hypothetical protein
MAIVEIRVVWMRFAIKRMWLLVATKKRAFLYFAHRYQGYRKTMEQNTVYHFTEIA